MNEQEKLIMTMSWENIVKYTYALVEKLRLEAQGEQILNEILGRKNND
jgi:hypothetical protein